MGLLEYSEIFLGFFLIWSGGRILIKNNVFSSLLAGMLVSGAILSVTARFMPLYSREIVGVFSLLGIIRLMMDLKNKSCVFAIKKEHFLLIPFIVLVAFYFRFFHFSNYIYESHDILYFGPALEILKADYWGNLRVPIYYPYEMAGYHLLPSAVIASIGFILSKPSLISFIEIRYLLIVLLFSSFFFRLWLGYRFNWRIYLPTCFCVLILFGEEFSFNLTISSFLYVFVVLQILLCVFEVRLLSQGNGNAHQESRSSELRKSLLLFSMFLIICKAPIFYIAGAMAFYYWYFLKNERWSWRTWLVSVLVLINIFSWIAIPAPAPEDAQFSIMNPFVKKDLQALDAIQSWSLRDNVKLGLENIHDHLFPNHDSYTSTNASLFQKAWNVLSKKFILISIILDFEHFVRINSH
ncbi:MAG: hypothetical protein HQM12_17615 [SAR324 cluster bacterium]|nr:hypothetical protein [SAR324 cluster bacterium]